MYDDIGDICLDMPNAYTALGQIVSKGEKAAFVPKHLAADVPQRLVVGWSGEGRVGEGQGKDEWWVGEDDGWVREW